MPQTIHLETFFNELTSLFQGFHNWAKVERLIALTGLGGAEAHHLNVSLIFKAHLKSLKAILVGPNVLTLNLLDCGLTVLNCSSREDNVITHFFSQQEMRQSVRR